jgi:S1-C subfamily serine protease/HEAT repeat protein
MLQIKCPHCQKAMAMNAMPPSGRVACTQCGQLLVLQAPVKQAPRPAAPQPPMVVEDEVQLHSPRAGSPQGSSIRPTPGHSGQVVRAMPVHAEPPRKVKKKKKKESTSTTTWLIVGGGVVCVIMVIAAVFIWSALGGKNDQAKIELPDPQKAVQIAKQDPDKITPPPEASRRNPGNNRPSNRDPDETDMQSGDGGGAKPDDTTEQPAAMGRSDSSDISTDVYNYVLKSAVFIVSPDEQRNRASIGSGSLIDKKNRLILTNHHVAGDAKKSFVFFPLYDNKGRLRVEREVYLGQFRGGDESKLMRAKIIATDPIRDLCILQVPRLPKGVEGLPLSKDGCRTGQRVHSVGNPGASGALWVYAPGVVRTFYHKKWLSKSEEGEAPSEHEADVIETQSPTNHGDSGGPLVNDRGELVGVTQGGKRDELGSVSQFIDVSEVKKFAAATAQSHLNTAWAPDARAPMVAGGGGGAMSAANLSDVVKMLSNADAAKRAKAAETLGEMGEKAKAAISSLLKLLNDPDDFVKRMATNALDKIGLPSKSDVPMLANLLRDQSVELRRYAARTLEKMGADARGALNDLLQATTDKDTVVRQHAFRSLGRFGRDAKDLILRPLEEGLKDEDRDVRLAAAESLGNVYASANDMESLRKLIKHDDPDIKVMAVKGLVKMGKNAKPALPEMMDLAKNDQGDLRKAVLQWIVTLDPADSKQAMPMVMEGLKNGDKDMKLTALALLANSPKEVQPSTVATLRDLVKDADVKEKALECLAKVAPYQKSALGVLVELVKEDGDSTEAAAKAIGEMGAAAAPAVRELIKLMDIANNPIQPADTARVNKIASLIAKIGKPAVKDLRAGALSRNITRWGCIIALGEIGPPAKEAIGDLQRAGQNEPNDFIREAIQEAIGKIQGR